MASVLFVARLVSYCTRVVCWLCWCGCCCLCCPPAHKHNNTSTQLKKQKVNARVEMLVRNGKQMSATKTTADEQRVRGANKLQSCMRVCMYVCVRTCVLAHCTNSTHQNIKGRKEQHRLLAASQRRSGAANAHNTTQHSATHIHTLAKVIVCVYKQQQIVSNPEIVELACEIQPVRSLHKLNAKAQVGLR